MVISKETLKARALFAKRLGTLLAEHNMNQNELAKLLNVSESTVGKWVLGKSMPRTMGLIQQLADYFNIGKSYFLEPSTPSTPSEPEYTDEEKGIITGYRKAPDPLKEIVRFTLKDYMKDEAPPKEQPKEAPKEEAPKIGKWGQIILHHKYALYQGFNFIADEEVESLAGNPKIERIVEDTYKKLEEADVDYDLFVERLVEIYKSHCDKLHALLNEPHDTAVLFLKKYISDRDNFI